MVSWQLAALFVCRLLAHHYIQELTPSARLINREWSEFYPKHDTYTFIGLLGGSRYYDEEGNETQVRKDIVHNAEEALRIQKEEWESSAEKRREEYEEKKKRRAENKRKYEELKKKQAAQAAAKTQ